MSTVRTCTAALPVVLWLLLPAAAQDAKTVIANAAKALGYDNLKTIEYSGSGLEGTALGQAQSAAAGWPKFTLKRFSRYVDLSAGTGQQTSLRSRPLDPATGQLPGGGGLAATPETQQTTVIAANGTWMQKLDVSLSPPGFLKLASAASHTTVKSQSMNGKKYLVVSFPVEAKAPSGVSYTLTGYINDQNMLEKVETVVEEPNLIGDMAVEQSYSGYKDFGGVKFPTRIVQKRAGLSWTDLTVTGVTANASAPPPPAPAAGRGGAAGGAAAGGRGAAPAMGSKKLGDGVYLITGGYRSVAVEFKDHIVLIEAPQNEMTTTNIIAETKKVIPNKPIKYVVNTHTHFDHSGGLRAAAAEGATVITHESNKGLYEKWFSNPRTLLIPDRLAESKKKPKFEYMGEKKILKDDTHTVELYHLNGALHAEDIIVAYLPKAKIVVEADAFNAPAPNAPAPQTINGFEKLLASELDRLKIDYSTIIPVHQPAGGDRDVMKTDLLKNIGRGN